MGGGAQHGHTVFKTVIASVGRKIPRPLSQGSEGEAADAGTMFPKNRRNMQHIPKVNFSFQKNLRKMICLKLQAEYSFKEQFHCAILRFIKRGF